MKVIIIILIILLLKLLIAKHASRKNAERKRIKKIQNEKKAELIKFWLECEHSGSRWIDFHFLQNHNSADPNKCEYMRRFYEKKKAECLSDFAFGWFLVSPGEYDLHKKRCAL